MTDNKYDHSPTGIRVIKTRADYDEMSRDLERLVDADPARGTPDRDRLDILLVLLADYESRVAPTMQVDSVDAILFRLEQLQLKPRDLEPYLGSRSRVSEVLSRKRPLSISMIRALHDGLGIPAEALINPASPPPEESGDDEVPWERFPVRELIARGWIAGQKHVRWTREAAKSALEPLLTAAGRPSIASAVHFRQSLHIRAARGMDDFALTAWIARVLGIAAEQPPLGLFESKSWHPERVQELVHLSRLETGPRLAQEWLSHQGISLVIVPHLPRTRLDGAALIAATSCPVLALTLRYDRLDNFWFTLMHEVGHILRHLSSDTTTARFAYLDDLDVDDAQDAREVEADSFASESLVPSKAWDASAVAFAPSADAALALADELGVNPAVVAGRVRHQKRNFRLLASLVGVGQVRRHFPEVQFD